MKQAIVIAVLAVFLCGCATSSAYHLRPGDELRVVIWKEMDEKVLVRPDKRISLPVVGEVSCRDKTPEDLSDELSEKYGTDTVVIVSKYKSPAETLKEIFGFLRDISFTYYFADKVIDD